jgi:hypothetical protein
MLRLEVTELCSVETEPRMQLVIDYQTGTDGMEELQLAIVGKTRS